MRKLKVAALREAIANVGDDTLVVLSGSDHSYRQVGSVDLVEAELSRGALLEYHGEDYKELPDNPVVDVLLIG